MISVIVPIYNCEKYIGRCFDSILGQTFSDLEIVAVNDGSTDRSGAIVESYCIAHPKKITYIATENRGVTAARITGIRAARGEWIGFVDSDDAIDPEMYEILYNNAIKYQADISHCGHRTIVNDGERVHYFYNTGAVKEQNQTEGLKDLITGAFEPSLWSKIFRRGLFNEMFETTDIDLSIKYNEDLLINYYLFKNANKSILEDRCLYQYYSRKGSATRKAFSNNMIYDPIRVRKAIRDDIEQCLWDEAEIEYLSICAHKYIELTNHTNCQGDLQRIRNLVIAERKYFSLLGLKSKLAARLIVALPVAIPIINRIRRRKKTELIYE